MRLDLGEGQWADIATRLTFGQVAIIRLAAIESESQPLSHPDMQRAYVAAMVTGWRILDEHGAEIPFGSLDPVPAWAADAMFVQCVEVFRQYRADPKGASGGATSAASSPAASS